jgi:hypothetical protein
MPIISVSVSKTIAPTKKPKTTPKIAFTIEMIIEIGSIKDLLT